MMNVFNANKILLPVISVLLTLGCSKEKDQNGDKTFAEMSGDDIIVEVNDSKLRKREVLIALGLNRVALDKTKSLEEQQKRDAMKHELLAYVPRYIFRRLLIDDTKARKTISEEYVSNCVAKAIQKNAKAQNKTPEEYLAGFKDGRSLVERNLADYVWLNAGMASNIPPKFVVNPQFVSNYLASVRQENEQIAASNAAMRATLEKIRENVLAGTAIFTNEAERISVEEWDLGEKERTEFYDKWMRNAAFSLKEGMVSPPFESEEEISMIQVAKVIPAVKNDKGKRVHPERRHIYKITLKRAQELLEPDFVSASIDLSRQSREQAIEEYVGVLFTNGQNRIYWPHGTNLWEKTN